MTENAAPELSLYYPGKDLAGMEVMLRDNYLSRSGWLESADRKLALRNGAPVPWFTYGAIALLEREIPGHTKVFEYGGGQSTLYWANRVSIVVSVDHDPSFGAMLQPKLPANATLKLVAESVPISKLLYDRGRAQPYFAEPERTTQVYRSGQLNQAFRSYGLQILEYAPNSFDVVIIDGMARNLSTWAALQHFHKNGFIVFNNSDRDFYRPAFDLLEDAGYRRVDFWGMGPINPYEWCTSVFYEHKSFTSTRWFPETAPQKVAPPAAARQGAGVLVLGYNRPRHLQAVLESLRQQGRLAQTHVWIDGTQDRAEFASANARTIEIAKRYRVAETCTQQGHHMGIEKMMLDALATMSGRYEQVIVLEDDCFPIEGAIDQLEADLQAVAEEPGVFSVYGQPFGTEPDGERDFTRFQGWGWGARSDRIAAILPELRDLYMMPEADYLAWIEAQMTNTIRARLDRTATRNVLKVLGRYFSWDSAISFLTARNGMVHRRTAGRTIYNTGISMGIGHFQRDVAWLREPPFNMIAVEEAWHHYSQARPVDPASRESFGLEGLDLRILEALADQPPGFLIEIGANDGVTQSNSVLLEAAGWKGMMIEANPAMFARCRRTRPGMIAEHAACVAEVPESGTVTLTDVGLMSLTERSALEGESREEWVTRGEGFTRLDRQDIDVPASTLSQLLDKHAVPRLDLLLLDVEGAEIDVLSGLDFSRHAPGWIVAEDAYDDLVSDFLAPRGYAVVSILSQRRFTRDRLYRKIVKEQAGPS